MTPAAPVTPVKLVPVMVTVLPDPPLVGVKLVMVGVAIMVKELLLPVPPGVVTVIAPVVALTGTTAVMRISLVKLKLVASTLLNFTAVTPVKPLPFRVTVIPTPAPATGLKLVI